MILCLFMVGCTTMTGPISGKKYSMIDGRVVNMPAYAKELREDYLSKNPSVPDAISEAIKKEQLIIGMTKEQVLASWGIPEKINTTTTERFIHEQLVYLVYHGSYAYLENGKLVSIQQ